MMKCGRCGCSVVHLKAKFDFPSGEWGWTVECDRGHKIVPAGKDDYLTFTFQDD